MASKLVKSFAGVTLCLLVACSGNTDADDDGSDGAGGSIVIGSGGSSASPGGGSGNGNPGAGGSSAAPSQCPITVGDSACAGEVYVGENVPLDIYVMFDQSGSMLNEVQTEQGKVTRLDAVRAAMSQFLQDPASAGIGAGIGYFGYQPIGQASCNPGDYDNAAVGLGELPGHAPAIIESLNGLVPTGETPTGAAIRGACSYATEQWRSHPGREVVILLVTDGVPEAPVTCNMGAGSCCPELGDAEVAAQECLTGEATLKTYVLGVGPSLQNLQQIAEAGGTDQAYLVGDTNVTQNVLAALNAIRAAASIPCELNLPPPPDGETLDRGLVNMVHTNTSCQSTTIYYRTTPAECDAENGGWFYDPADDQKIRLCERTCNDVKGAGNQLLFTVGCESVVEIE